MFIHCCLAIPAMNSLEYVKLAQETSKIFKQTRKEQVAASGVHVHC